MTRILSISITNNTFHCLELDQKDGRFFRSPAGPQILSREGVLTACGRAERIFLNADFSEVLYEWRPLPRVSKKNMAVLVERDADETHGLGQKHAVQFREIRQVLDEGSLKSLVHYMGVQSEQLSEIHSLLRPFQKKVKRITSLPSAVAGATATLADAEQSFMILLAEEERLSIIISSANGEVLLNRRLPLALPLTGDISSEGASTLNQELSRTLSFFRQRFKEELAPDLYCLGNPSLAAFLDDHLALAGNFAPVHGFDNTPFEGIDDSAISQEYSLLANLVAPSTSFNFLPYKEHSQRKAQLASKAFALLVVALLAGAVLYTKSVLAKVDDKKITFDNLRQEISMLRSQVSRTRQQSSSLAPVRLQQQLLQGTSLLDGELNWPHLFDDLNSAAPPAVLLNSLNVSSSGRGWQTQLHGEVRGATWQEGLAELRSFGAALQNSASFTVQDLNYRMEKPDDEMKNYSFRIELKISTEENHAR